MSNEQLKQYKYDKVSIKKGNFNKLLKHIHKDGANYKEIDKWVDKKLFPQFEKIFLFKNPQYQKMQIETLGGKHHFFNRDVFNYHDEKIPIYSSIICLEDVEINLIISPDIKFKNYKKEQINIILKKGECLTFHSEIYYCFPSHENEKILKINNIFPTMAYYNKYKESSLHIKTNNKNFVDHIYTRLGLCYKKKLHYRYTWIHFFHLYLLSNDFHQKLNLQDLPNEKKTDRIVSYQPYKEVLLANTDNKTPIDQTICKDNIEVALEDNYYFSRFILLTVFIMLLIIWIIFLKDKELRNYFTLPMKNK